MVLNQKDAPFSGRGVFFQYPLFPVKPPSGKNGTFSQLLLYAQELVILCQTVGTAHRTGLDLPGIGSHGDIGNCGILRLTGAVGSHRRITRTLCHANSIKRLGQRPDLVHLNQNGIGASASIPFRRYSTFVTNKSSPTNWQRPPILSVNNFQPSQSFSAIPSSMESMGYLPINCSK